MASAVMLILVSPAVPSPVTTVPIKHTVQPPQTITPLAAALITFSAPLVNPLHEMMLAPPAHLACSGSDVVDLNTARLC